MSLIGLFIVMAIVFGISHYLSKTNHYKKYEKNYESAGRAVVLSVAILLALLSAVLLGSALLVFVFDKSFELDFPLGLIKAERENFEIQGDFIIILYIALLFAIGYHTFRKLNKNK